MWKQVPKYLEKESDLMMLLPRPSRLMSRDGELYYWYEKPQTQRRPDEQLECDSDQARSKD